MYKQMRFLVTLVLVCLLPTSTAWAALAIPQGPVILTISGDIEHANVGDEAHFDYEMLRELSMHEITTHTPWTEGRGRFEGPLARIVMEAVGARGQHLRITALDGYAADVPLSDFHDYDVILALKRNGNLLQIRDLGPVLVLYPFDDHPKLHTETIRFRSVWQVARIHVKE